MASRIKAMASAAPPGFINIWARREWRTTTMSTSFNGFSMVLRPKLPCRNVITIRPAARSTSVISR
jgi:hypothetical protein